MSFAQVEPLSTPANIEKARTIQKYTDNLDESKKELEAIRSLKLNLDIELSRKELEIDALKNSQELLKRKHGEEIIRLGYDRSILEHQLKTQRDERDNKEKILENKSNNIDGVFNKCGKKTVEKYYENEYLFQEQLKKEEDLNSLFKKREENILMEFDGSSLERKPRKFST